MFKNLFARFEQWLHEHNRNTQIRAWVQQVIDTHPDVTERMKDWAGLADPRKPAPIEANAFFIGHNLYIGHRLSFQPMIDQYCIWTAEHPGVHIHNATLLFENKILIHGEWERLIIGLLSSAYDTGLMFAHENKLKAQQLEADRLAYFARL